MSFIPFCANVQITQVFYNECNQRATPDVLKDTYERTGNFPADTEAILAEHVGHMLTDLSSEETQLIVNRTLKEVMLVNSTTPLFNSWKITFWVKVGRWRVCVTIIRD